MLPICYPSTKRLPLAAFIHVYSNHVSKTLSSQDQTQYQETHRSHSVELVSLMPHRSLDGLLFETMIKI